MLDGKNIHNSAILKPQVAKQPHTHTPGEIMPDGSHKCLECGKILSKG